MINIDTEKINFLSDKDRLLLYRFMYRIGEPLISDYEYDLFVEALLNTDEPDPAIIEITSRLWDAEPVPYEVLSNFYSMKEITNLVKENGLAPSLDEIVSPTAVSTEEFKATSIKAYRDPVAAFEWFKSVIGVELCVTPKIDGISSSQKYENSTLISSRTRGRGGGDKFFDITKNMSLILPKVISTSNLTVNGEVFVPQDDLKAVSSAAGHSYVAERNAAIATVRRDDLPESIIKLTKCYVFNASQGDTLTESLDIAKANGFDVVPYWKHTFISFTSYDDFISQVSSLVKEIKDWADNNGIPTDGVVFQINDKNIFANSSEQGHYRAGNMAFKCLYWNPGEYTSTVERLIIEKDGDSLENYCVKLAVTPVRTKSGKTLKTVNLYNLKTLIANNINVGDTVVFIHKNDTTNEFIRKGVKTVSKEFYEWKAYAQTYLDRVFGQDANDPAFNKIIFKNPENYIKVVTDLCQKIVVHNTNLNDLEELLNYVYNRVTLKCNDKLLDSVYPGLSNSLSLLVDGFLSRSLDGSATDYGAREFLDKLMKHENESYISEILTHTPSSVIDNAIYRIVRYADALTGPAFQNHFFSFVGQQFHDILVLGKEGNPTKLQNYLDAATRLKWVNWDDAESIKIFFAKCRRSYPLFLQGGLNDVQLVEFYSSLFKTFLGYSDDSYNEWYNKNKHSIDINFRENVKKQDALIQKGIDTNQFQTDYFDISDSEELTSAEEVSDETDAV